jgi:hypothetical protein
MSPTRVYSTIALCFVALSAQTPAPPATSAAPAAPLRSLEYSFSVDYQSLGGADTGSIGTTVGAARESYTRGSGRQGKLYAEVLAVAKDGGLVIRAAEFPDTEAKVQQYFTCAVYPDMRVLCPGTLPVTDAETTLMQFLGRNFIDASAIDASNHFQQKYSNQYVTSVGDFTIVSTAADGKLATIQGHTTVKSVNGVNSDWTDNSKLVYDLTKEVPVSLHVDSRQKTRGDASYSAIMDFKLTKDSLSG